MLLIGSGDSVVSSRIHFGVSEVLLAKSLSAALTGSMLTYSRRLFFFVVARAASLTKVSHLIGVPLEEGEEGGGPLRAHVPQEEDEHEHEHHLLLFIEHTHG